MCKSSVLTELWISIEDLEPSSKAWVDAVLADFDAFLIDHANCERKASSMLMSFVAKYPDRTEIIPELIETAIEELEHFQKVYDLLEKRGLRLPHKIEKDVYMQALHGLCRHGRDERFLDRLIVSGVVEVRGVERFKTLSEHLSDEVMKTYYDKLWRAESTHGTLFIEMARKYFKDEDVRERLHWWIEREREVLLNTPFHPKLH